jgi:hypothetical protein
MRDVTAILMGDPASRVVRHPTAVEIERTRYREAMPARGLEDFPVGKLTPIGARVYAMQPGDRIPFDCARQARNFCQRMRDLRGWRIRVQICGGKAGEKRSAILERLA